MRINVAFVMILIAVIFLNACVSSHSDGRVLSLDDSRGFVIYSNDDARSTLARDNDRPRILRLIDEFKDELKSNPRNQKARLSLADLFLVLGKYEIAEKLCRHVLRRDFRNSSAKKILAQIALRRGNYDLASIYIESLGGQRSRDSSILNMLAMIEVQRGNNSRALVLFQDALKLNSSDLAARMNLGVIYLKYRMFSQAALEFERVLKIIPEHSDAMIHLAVVEIARGHDNSAEKLLRFVLNREESNPLALYNLSIVLKNQQRYDEALASIKSYLKTAKGRSQDNDQVFALVDEIKKSQVESGLEVSDEDMQQLATSAAQQKASRRALVGGNEVDRVSATKRDEESGLPNESASRAGASDASDAELEAEIRN